MIAKSGNGIVGVISLLQQKDLCTITKVFTPRQQARCNAIEIFPVPIPQAMLKLLNQTRHVINRQMCLNGFFSLAWNVSWWVRRPTYGSAVSQGCGQEDIVAPPSGSGHIGHAQRQVRLAKLDVILSAAPTTTCLSCHNSHKSYSSVEDAP